MEEKLNQLIDRIEQIKELDPEGLDSSYDSELNELTKRINVLNAAMAVVGDGESGYIDACIKRAAERV